MIRTLLVMLACACVVAYAWLIEPYRLEVSEHAVGTGGQSDRPIRIVQRSASGPRLRLQCLHFS